MSEQTVAVIVRTKDRPLLLRRALKSITGQTATNWVAVVINDGGSKSDVQTVIDEFPKFKQQIQVIHNQISIGMEAASNKAIKNSSSEFVVIHDDDDSWHADFLRVTCEALQDEAVMGVVVPTDVINERIEGSKITTVSTRRLYPALKEINLYKMCSENYAAPISFIFRRQVFKRIGMFDETLQGAGDWDFGLRFLIEYNIDYIDYSHALAYYHHRVADGGPNTNSVYTDTHRQQLNRLLNRYLREDIKAGKLGIGYITNAIRYNYEREQEVVKCIVDNSTALSNQLNHQHNDMRAHVDQIRGMNSKRRIREASKRLVSKATRKGKQDQL